MLFRSSDFYDAQTQGFTTEEKQNIDSDLLAEEFIKQNPDIIIVADPNELLPIGTDPNAERIALIVSVPAVSGKPIITIPFNCDIDINLDFLKDLKWPEIDWEKFFIPTIDIMAQISIQLEFGINQALFVALLQMIKNIILGVVKDCGDLSKVNFGAIKFDEILGNMFNLNKIGRAHV